MTFANKGAHPIYVNLPFFELSPNKIHAIKSIKLPENLPEYIIQILEIISLNHLPHEVKLFVRHCDTTKHQYNQCTLIGSSDSLLGYSGTRDNNWNIRNLDFFLELVSIPEEWEGYRASQQNIIAEVTPEERKDYIAHQQKTIAAEDYDLSDDDAEAVGVGVGAESSSEYQQQQV